MFANYTPSELDRFINGFTLRELADEYNLIKQKKCKFSRSQRDAIEGTIHYLERNGKIVFNEDGTASLYIKLES